MAIITLTVSQLALTGPHGARGVIRLTSLPAVGAAGAAVPVHGAALTHGALGTADLCTALLPTGGAAGRV